MIEPDQIEHLREAYPEAEFLMHPECGCLTKQMELADRILSTDGMMRYVKESPARSFIVATENGILYGMRKQNPEKSFIPASEHASCHHMQRNTLEKVFRSLVHLEYEVKVDLELTRRARLPIERMLNLTQAKREPSSLNTWESWDDWVLEAANDLS